MSRIPPKITIVGVMVIWGYNQNTWIIVITISVRFFKSRELQKAKSIKAEKNK